MDFLTRYVFPAHSHIIITFVSVASINREKSHGSLTSLVTMLGKQRVYQVACGWRHTVATTMRGNVYSWGRGTSGQLGHGDALDRYKS